MLSESRVPWKASLPQGVQPLRVGGELWLISGRDAAEKTFNKAKLWGVSPRQ